MFTIVQYKIVERLEMEMRLRRNRRETATHNGPICCRMLTNLLCNNVRLLRKFIERKQ